MTISIRVYATARAPEDRIDAVAQRVESFVPGEVRRPRSAALPPVEPPRYWKSHDVESSRDSVESCLETLLTRLIASGIKDISDEISVVIVEEHGSANDVGGFYLSRDVLRLAAQIGADIDIDVYQNARFKSPRCLDDEALRDVILLLAGASQVNPGVPLYFRLKPDNVYGHEVTLANAPSHPTRLGDTWFLEPAIAGGGISFSSIEELDIYATPDPQATLSERDLGRYRETFDYLARALKGVRGVTIFPEQVSWRPSDAPGA